jgi:hypothetical protein
MAAPSAAESLNFALVFDPRANRLTIGQLDERSERWYREHLPEIGALLDGLCGETPVMTPALLDEIRLKFMQLAAESGPVRCQLRTGTITTRDPKRVAEIARRGLETAMRGN